MRPIASCRSVKMAVEYPCQHEELLLRCSPWAEEAGFERPDAAKRCAATTRTGRNPFTGKGRAAKTIKELSQDAGERLSSVFPGPLVLPNDELNWDPDCPPQSFRSWLTEPQRNKLTPERKTLYVAAPPMITSKVGFMKDWMQPTRAIANDTNRLEPSLTDALLQYLTAFYHGIPVKPFSHRLRFVPWAEPSKGARSQNKHDYVGLEYNGQCTRIRTRAAPDKMFKRQLNLNDLIDAAIDMLPEDAYSIALLSDFDLYEDEDDDFCCGRAYGGSRVCVVSSVRYHPSLDVDDNIDREHMWPASHCKKFTDKLCAIEGLKPQEHTKSKYETPNSPLWRAVEETKRVPMPSTVEDCHGQWFSRVARTLAHELGHCFGMDHCVYYACSMQGTSGMAEDVRQPPYLCPVCLEKVAYAIACELETEDQASKDDYIRERYQAAAKFCENWKHVELFASYYAWIQARLEQLTT